MRYAMAMLKPLFFCLALVLVSLSALAQTSDAQRDNRAQIDRLLDENEALRGVNDELIAALEKASIPEAASDVADLEAEIERLSSALNDAHSTTEQLEQALSLTKERERQATDRVGSLLDELEKSKRQQQALNAQMLEAQEQQRESERERRELKDSLVRTESMLKRCESDKGQSCVAAIDQCEDAVDAQVNGILATVQVVNECRRNSRLTVRLRPSDILPARMVTEFDDKGVAELIFPVLDNDTHMRLLGDGDNVHHDLTLSPQSQFDKDFVILRWEDEQVNLDLLMKSESSGNTASEYKQQAEFGEMTLAQNLASRQVPRFEIFTAGDNKETLAIQVSHASRQERAVPPFCGQAEAASPTFLLMVRDRDGFRQNRGKIDSVPCGQAVPSGEGSLFLDRFNPR